LRHLILPAILLLAGCACAEPDGTAWDYLPGQGYQITHRVTHPGTTAGTAITIVATARWYNSEGVQMGEAVSDPCTIIVASETRIREWTYNLPSALQAVLDSGSGDGTLVVSGGELRARVEVPNDGAQHVFSWRMELR